MSQFPPEIWLVAVNGSVLACRDEAEVQRLVEHWAEYSVRLVDLNPGSPCLACGGRVTYPERNEPEVIGMEVARLGGDTCG